MRASRGETIQGDPTVMIEKVQDKFGFTQAETGGILNHLIQGGDLSKYGLHAAVTRAAADLESYDRATELEQIGADIIDLPKNQWQTLAVAA